ncbi:MAG TPA: thioredoxin domain-containing protein [Solirubrobacterales bacterium]|jgi:protein-disulfide isomerase
MSAKKDREKRREERQQRQSEAAENARRERLIKLASAAAFLAIVAVAVAVVISQSQTSGGDTNLENIDEVETDLANIPQHRLTLGLSTAKVKLVEFGDLQCPICREFAVNVLPELIENKVRTGEARLEFRNYPILGPESVTAAPAAIAAGEQNRGWDFIELFYKNQGTENTGYVSEEFLTSIAKGAKVPDIPRWNRDREGARAKAEVKHTTAEAEQLGFGGTPSFAVEGPGTKGLEPLGTPGSLGEFEEAIDDAA